MAVPQPMLRHTAFVALLGLLSPLLRAQVNELGLTAGVCYYIGDLNPYKHYPNGTALAYGGVFRHNFDEHYALRLQGLFGKLRADDADSPDSLQQLRNLSFKANLFEASALLEINFFQYRSGGKDKKDWTPFVFAGLAYFRANPKAELNGTWYDLQPLGTEGQGSSGGGEPYKVDQVCIPFGAGMKFNFHRVDLQLEWGLRRTYTDYIDDVSSTYVDNDLLAYENGDLAAALADRSDLADSGFNTGRARGDNMTRDWYQYTGISLTVLLGPRFTECDELYKSMKQRGR
jgi:hypothetical protein